MRNLSQDLLLSSYSQSIAFGLIFGMLLAISFILGFISYDLFVDVSHIQQISRDSKENNNYPILQEVHYLLNEVYLRPLPDATTLEYGAIYGMIATLEDDVTYFIEPPVARSESQALAGTYGGIGVLVNRSESGDFVLFPFADGPASHAGVRDNDIILSVNTIEITSDFSVDEIDQLLRGEVNDENGVSISVSNLDDNVIRNYFVPFRVINVPSVTSRLTVEDSTIAYVQIHKFTSRTPEELNEQLSQLQDNEISALILDLRDNSGGLLIESIEVADMFIDDGVILTQKSRDSTEVFDAKSGSILPNTPIAIIINEKTASAAELVAGALRDNGIGILFGQKTFGKGTVQQIFPLSDGSSIHITSAEWLLPSNQSLSTSGLEPDFSIIPDESDRDVEFAEAVRYLQSVTSKQEK